MVGQSSDSVSVTKSVTPFEHCTDVWPSDMAPPKSFFKLGGAHPQNLLCEVIKEKKMPKKWTNFMNEVYQNI